MIAAVNHGADGSGSRRAQIAFSGVTLNLGGKAILEDVWGLNEDTDTRAIDNFIVRLRRYIEQEPGKPKHLLTVRGVGYRFTASPEK